VRGSARPGPTGVGAPRTRTCLERARALEGGISGPPGRGGPRQGLGAGEQTRSREKSPRARVASDPRCARIYSATAADRARGPPRIAGAPAGRTQAGLGLSLSPLARRPRCGVWATVGRNRAVSVVQAPRPHGATTRVHNRVGIGLGFHLTLLALRGGAGRKGRGAAGGCAGPVSRGPTLALGAPGRWDQSALGTIVGRKEK